jgi:hypothetical protein
MIESGSVKEQLLAALQSGPSARDYLLSLFDDAAQRRGAAGLLSYLVRSGQVEVDDEGIYRLTGRPAQPIARKRQQLQPQVEVPAASPAPELQWALWHDGDLLIRRGEMTVVLTSEERKRIGEWMRKAVTA